MLKYIGFPIKDGCHVNGCDKGIDVLKDKIKFDNIINIDKYDNDLESVINNNLKLASCTNDVINNGDMPITIGGDHSLAIGSIAGVSANEDIGVIWFDTHPDINTDKTTETFHIHGYPLAASMGFGQDKLTKLYKDKTKVNYENVILFGINDIDKPEQELINKYNIKCFTLDDINNKGIEYCTKEAIKYLNNKCNKIHLSFDIDVINKNECPGVNVPNQYGNGMNRNDVFYSLNEFLNNLNIISIDIVEYNPINDIDNKSLNIVLDAVKLIKK